jgi:hypothetical protein
MARIAATKRSDDEVQRLVQDAYLAFKGVYGALELAIKEADGIWVPQRWVKIFGIHELSPEEQSRLRRYLATSELACLRRGAGLLSLALLAEVPITKFDKGALGPDFTKATFEEIVKVLTRKASYNYAYGSGCRPEAATCLMLIDHDIRLRARLTHIGVACGQSHMSCRLYWCSC